MKIAFVYHHDSLDVRTWSGTPYYMSRSLQGPTHEVTHISPLADKWALALKGKKLFHRMLTGREYLRDREPLVLESYSRQVAERLGADVRVVFSPSTIPISRLQCAQPIVFWSDAVFAGMVNFYPAFTNLTARSRKAGHAMEHAALARCALAIYSSTWAADAAVAYYGADPDKVKVVPFGANLDNTPSAVAIATIIDSRPSDRCMLLFNGVDWWRKGGDVAVEVARLLNASGLDTTLTVIGHRNGSSNGRFVRELGFISKDTPEGRRVIGEELAMSHFLILPSRADCTPVVLCEANAFAVPCLVSRVGGIPSTVRDGINGQSFAPDARPEDYSNYIVKAFSHYHHYRRLARSSYEEYAARLNWATAGSKVRRLLDQFVPTSQ